VKVEVVFKEDGGYSIRWEGRTIAPGSGPLPPPPVFFVGSLAACAGVFAFDYLRTRELPRDGLKILAEAQYGENPRRISYLDLRVALPAPVADRHLAPLQRSVDLCTLKNTLEHAPVIFAEVQVPELAAGEGARRSH
jgi:ribosomal protein S12 methylthiotransferase accessory factor